LLGSGQEPTICLDEVDKKAGRRFLVQGSNPQFAWQQPTVCMGRLGNVVREIMIHNGWNYERACSLVVDKTACPQNCFLVTAFAMSSVYTAVAWQLV
jgi:hypothetical protein